LNRLGNILRIFDAHFLFSFIDNNPFAKIALRHLSSNSPRMNGDKQRFKALLAPNSW